MNVLPIILLSASYVALLIIVAFGPVPWFKEYKIKPSKSFKNHKHK